MNEYLQIETDFQSKLREYAANIFKTYGRELVLRLEEYNLLQNKHNCIESSTAIGFVLEEFLVSKLEMYTHCDSDSEYVINRFSGATASESFDCFSVKDGIKFMVNVKAEKAGSNANNAIAAIEQLHRNYCKEEEAFEKCFILFKVHYSIKDAYEDDENRRAKPRHIYIDDLSSYALESVDFSEEWSQDNRNWSQKEDGKKTRNNGRLQVSKKFRKDHPVAEENISFRNTCNQIDIMWHKNEECWMDNVSLLKLLGDNPSVEYVFTNYKGFYEEQKRFKVMLYAEDSISVEREGEPESSVSYTVPEFSEAFKDNLWELVNE